MPALDGAHLSGGHSAAGANSRCKSRRAQGRVFALCIALLAEPRLKPSGYTL